MGAVSHDFRYALRVMRLNPGFTCGIALVLALGIGANTAIFTVVNAVLLQPLQYRAPDRLVRLYEYSPLGSALYNVVSPANFIDWEREAHSFAEMAAYSTETFNLAGSGGSLPERLQGVICAYRLFSTLGVQPALGRAFVPEDDRPEAERVVILSHNLWQRRFGGSAAIVGELVRLDGNGYRVVGVAPPGFDYPDAEAQFWTPLWRNRPARDRLSRGNHRYDVVARLKPGVTVEQAQGELDGIAKRIKREHPADVTGNGASVALLSDRLVVRVRALLLVLLGAVGCVLLIACVNVTNLLLARAISRRREVAIRLALGAGRTRLVRQFLIESTVLSALGAALGLLFAYTGVKLLTVVESGLPRLAAVRLSTPVYLFTLAVAMLTGIAVGLAPAFSSLEGGLGRLTVAGRTRRRLSNALVAAEVALSLILLIGAGLLLKSFGRLRAVDPGFAPERLLTMRFSLPEAQYKTPAARTAFFENLLARVRALPGVTAAGMIQVLPATGHAWDNTFSIEGHAPLPPGQFLDALFRVADPGYFQAMGIPLKRGRFFAPSERLDTAKQAIISESMAKEFFRGEDPLGRRLKIDGPGLYEIVGVVGDVRSEMAQEPEPTMYVPLLKGAFNMAALVVRTVNDPNGLALPVQKEIAQLDPDLPVARVLTMEQVLARGYSQRTFSLTLISLFATLATALAAIGLYGLLAYSIRQRTGELGIRMALGATPSRVVGMTLTQGLKPALLGLIVGLSAAAGVTRVLESLLFDVKSLDGEVFGLVAVLLFVIAGAACLIPARRAARIDPAVALRTE